MAWEVSGWAGFDDDDAEVRARGLAGGGAAVAVGGGKVADGGAADEEVLQLAVDDDVYGLGGDAFVVDGVGADEALAVEGGEGGVVDDVEGLGEDLGVEGRGVGALGAGGGADLGAVGLDVGDEEAVEDVGCGVAGEEDGAVIVVGGDYGGFAEVFEALEVVDGALAEGCGVFEVLGVDGGGAVVAAEAHAVGGLSADADGGVVAGVALADDGALGVDEVAVDGDGADVGVAELDVGGEGADLGVRGVEAAGFDDALLPGCCDRGPW